MFDNGGLAGLEGALAQPTSKAPATSRRNLDVIVCFFEKHSLFHIAMLDACFWPTAEISKRGSKDRYGQGSGVPLGDYDAELPDQELLE